MPSAPGARWWRAIHSRIIPKLPKQVKDIGGGWGEVDTEAIVALAPDLVLAAEINATEQVKSLEDLGLNVYYLSNPKTLDGMYDNLRTVARLTGHEAETETLIESLKSRVSAVDAKIAGVTDKTAGLLRAGWHRPQRPLDLGTGHFRRPAAYPGWRRQFRQPPG